ncbi:MAG: metallophosphoesterase [Candidatus Latescibacterota bacterium]|nr:metallophosphoesterase [Candidatus Latescibacterota bacterium]
MTDPLFRFLQINDLHLTAEGDRFAGATARVEWVADSVQRGDFGDIRFLVSVGDQAQGGSPKQLVGDLKRFHSVFDPVGLPVYAVPGNHDSHEDQSKLQTPFLAAFERETMNFTFRESDFRFVMLDNCSSGQASPEAYARRAAWLQQTLEAHAEEKIILCCHIPLVPMRERDALKRSLYPLDATWCLEPEILKLVHAHADAVQAVLCGHLHLTGMVCVRSIIHICLAGTACYPCDIGVYSVYEDRIDVEVRQLPLELLAHKDTDLHGKVRRKVDHIDDVHPTHVEYVMGTVDERKFVIPLKC